MNLHTKQSQWDRPTEPVYPPPADGAPAGPPPSYNHNDSRATGPEKGGYGSNNPYGAQSNVTDDEAYARKLQEEENARAQSSRGAADTYYQGAGAGVGAASAAPQYGQNASPYGQTASPSPYGQQQLPPRDQAAGSSKGGFLSKLMGKASGSRPQQGYGGYPQQQQQQGYYPQQAQGGYGGYPPQQQYYQQQPQKKHGMGAGTGALLGGGAGLLGGMLLMDEMEDHSQQSYDQGYDQGVSDPFSPLQEPPANCMGSTTRVTTTTWVEVETTTVEATWEVVTSNRTAKTD